MQLYINTTEFWSNPLIQNGTEKGQPSSRGKWGTFSFFKIHKLLYKNGFCYQQIKIIFKCFFKKICNGADDYRKYVSSLFYLFIIGKVAIKKEDLCNHSGKETWFSLQPVDSNSEVQVNIKE